MHSSPRVSVLLPFHRLDEYLVQAIDSILQQTFADFELLLIADARLQGSFERVEELTRADARVCLLWSFPVGGIALGLNLGIGHARGVYIARMDGDDVSLPERLEKQVRFMDAHPEVVALGGRLELMDERGAALTSEYPFYGNDASIRAVLPLRNPMPHPALMFRRCVLVQVGGYKYAHSAEDWELFLRLARNHSWKLHNLDHLLVRYRRHAGQVTRPELTATVFYETAGFLFSEFLRTRSLKYLVGIAIKFPPLVQLRLALWR